MGFPARKGPVPGSCTALPPSTCSGLSVLCPVDHPQPQNQRQKAKLHRLYTFPSNRRFLPSEPKSTGPDSAGQVQHKPGNAGRAISAIPQPRSFPKGFPKCSFWCCLFRITPLRRMPLLRSLSILCHCPRELLGCSKKSGTDRVAHFWNRNNLDLPCFNRGKKKKKRKERANNKDSLRKAKLQLHSLSSNII